MRWCSLTTNGDVCKDDVGGNRNLTGYCQLECGSACSTPLIHKDVLQLMLSLESVSTCTVVVKQSVCTIVEPLLPSGGYWQVRRCVEQSAVNKYIDTSRPMINDRSVYLAMFTRVFTQTPRHQQLQREHRVWRQQSTVHLEILSKATQEHRRWLLPVYIYIFLCSIEC